VNEDLAHDAHLRAALRHAPDHALSPPSRVTYAILAAARQAHRQEVLAAPVPPPPMRPAGAPSLRHWLRRTASPRWAGAWAVALLAALGWGLWLDLGPRPEEGHPGGGAMAPIAAVPELAQQGPAAGTPRADTDDAPPQAGAEAAGPLAKFAEGDAAAPPLALLRRAQSEVATGSARWTWSAPGRPVIKPLDSTAMAWLARVAQSAQGTWRDASERGEGVEAAEARWWRDGWPAATLRIEAHGLRWIEPGGPVRYAPLDAATSQQLRGF